MEKKLSQKEREEAVTKGFLEDYLDMRLQEQTTEFKQYMEALMEHHMSQLQVFMEHMDDRYVLRREWNSTMGV